VQRVLVQSQSQWFHNTRLHNVSLGIHDNPEDDRALVFDQPSFVCVGRLKPVRGDRRAPPAARAVAPKSPPPLETPTPKVTRRDPSRDSFWTRDVTRCPDRSADLTTCH